MSYILDALKKSEAERQRQAGPALLEVRVVRPRRRWPVWMFVISGLLIASNTALIAWLLVRSPSSPNAPGPATPAATDTAAGNATPAAPVAPPAWVQNPVAAAPLPADGFIDETTNPDLAPATQPLGSARSGLQNYAEVAANLPLLRLDLHVFANAPADRYAFINMRKVKEGDTTAEGMRVLEITRDGVVLGFRDTEFVLGRE